MRRPLLGSNGHASCMLRLSVEHGSVPFPDPRDRTRSTVRSFSEFSAHSWANERRRHTHGMLRGDACPNPPRTDGVDTRLANNEECRERPIRIASHRTAPPSHKFRTASSCQQQPNRPFFRRERHHDTTDRAATTAPPRHLQQCRLTTHDYIRQQHAPFPTQKGSEEEEVVILIEDMVADPRCGARRSRCLGSTKHSRGDTSAGQRQRGHNSGAVHRDRPRHNVLLRRSCSKRPGGYHCQ